EINRKVINASRLIADIEERYASQATDIDYTDGLSMSFPEWRFNIRTSNTEPLLRLNVESNGDQRLMETKREELLGLINR
ncbi:phosphomannomutase CpsG, partial [Enterobacter kobei]